MGSLGNNVVKRHTCLHPRICEKSLNEQDAGWRATVSEAVGCSLGFDRTRAVSIARRRGQ
jgi:hypothetical protein